MKVLITGFGPFPGMPRNPAGEAARRLGRLRRPALAGWERTVLILPTEWQALGDLPAVLDRLKPGVVLMLGVASRRRKLSVEVRALNGARGLDAAKRRPQTRLVAAGPAILGLTASGPALAHALRGAGVPAALSRDAGRYLCNGAYYTALSALAGAGVPVAFLHLPGRGPESRRSARQMDFALSQALIALGRAR